MTALVYLRSSFGYVFLRPKSVFFAFSWAGALFCYAAWKDPEIWRGGYWAVCFFVGGAIILYWLHLAISVSRQLYRHGEHDHYSGTSHLLRLSSENGSSDQRRELVMHLYVEPIVILVSAAILRFVFRERHLSTWLVFVTVCMVAKETMNYWSAIRRAKVATDTQEDVQVQARNLSSQTTQAEKPQPTRKEAVKRERRRADESPEIRFAGVLGLRPPVILKDAEESYHALIRTEHPDANEGSTESNARTAELNEAIAYFRKKSTN